MRCNAEAASRHGLAAIAHGDCVVVKPRLTVTSRSYKKPRAWRGLLMPLLMEWRLGLILLPESQWATLTWNGSPGWIRTTDA